MPAGQAGEPRDALGEQLGRTCGTGEEAVVAAPMAPQQQRAPHHRYKCVFKALAGPGRCLLSPKPAVLLWTQSREQGGPFLELSSSAAL